MCEAGRWRESPQSSIVRLWLHSSTFLSGLSVRTNCLSADIYVFMRAPVRLVFMWTTTAVNGSLFSLPRLMQEFVSVRPSASAPTCTQWVTASILAPLPRFPVDTHIALSLWCEHLCVCTPVFISECSNFSCWSSMCEVCMQAWNQARTEVMYCLIKCVTSVYLCIFELFVWCFARCMHACFVYVCVCVYSLLL